MAPAQELSDFVSMAPTPAPELYFFIAWLRFQLQTCQVLVLCPSATALELNSICSSKIVVVFDVDHKQMGCGEILNN